MKNWTVVVILLYLALANGGIVPIRNFKHLLLKQHNHYRENQGSSNMNKMVWDDKLSRKAQNWIRKCRFEHKNGPGENLAFDSNTKTIVHYIKDALQSWYDEYKTYDYNRKSCSLSGSCHYTQMVWAETRKVGCAMRICRYLSVHSRFVENAWYLACFYDPIGNDATKYPFLKGAACSRCTKNQRCSSKGLCLGRPKQPCENKHAHCERWSLHGKCKHNRAHMRKTCRKACGLCAGHTGKNPFNIAKKSKFKGHLSRIVGNKHHPGHTVRRAKIIVRGIHNEGKLNGDCKNMMSAAKCKELNMFCNNNRNVMGIYCKKSCGFC